MSLVTYDETRPWAKAIRQRVITRQMPPWHIDKTVGVTHFANDRSLSDQQIATVVKWVDNGAPMGSTIRVTTAAGASITCRVVSRGPFAVGRIVDVAKATFALLAPTSQGVVNVRVTW